MCVCVCVDNLVPKVSRAGNGSAIGQVEVEVSPVGTSTVAAISPPPPPPPFARAPAEDRRKYEKLFCYGYSDAEDELEDREGDAGGTLRQDSRNSKCRESREGANSNNGRLNKNSARLNKLTDDDSIGSATDLKNCCSDEETDEQPKRKCVTHNCFISYSVKFTNIFFWFYYSDKITMTNQKR